MKYIFRIANLLILAVLLQAVYFIALVYTLSNLSPFTRIIMTAFGFFCVLFIISGKDSAIYKLYWSVAILFLPAVIGAVYLFYNRRAVGRRVEADYLLSRKNAIKSLSENIPEISESITNRLIAAYIEKASGLPPSFCTDSQYFPRGEDFFKSLLAELKKARRYIFIEFFIIEQGKMWNQILEVLVSKLGEGVEVRIFYDGSASLYTLPDGYYRKLRKMGFKCMVFNPLRRFISFRFNTRNHRKVAVIDGNVAFCGGLNLTDDYINAKPFAKTGNWKDSAVLVKGQAAWNLALTFFTMWDFSARRLEDLTPYLPEKSVPENAGTACVWHDLPLDCDCQAEHILLDFIHRADNYIYLITPYLIPPESVSTALCLAAKSGVDVRLILPFIPDKYLVNAVTKSNYSAFLEAGVRIFEYSPGFIHSKNIISDDARAMVGTLNLDYRALYMHHECGIVFFGEKIIADIKSDFLETEKICREILLSEYRNTSVFRRGLRRACRLLEPFI